jgi:hypothetical protein
VGHEKSKQDCRRERVVKIKPEKGSADQVTDLLMFDLRREGNNVTALLAPKGQQLRCGPSWGSLRRSFMTPPHRSQRGGTSGMWGGTCILFPDEDIVKASSEAACMDADPPAPRVVTNPDETDIASMTVPLKP